MLVPNLRRYHCHQTKFPSTSGSPTFVCLSIFRAISISFLHFPENCHTPFNEYSPRSFLNNMLPSPEISFQLFFLSFYLHSISSLHHFFTSAQKSLNSKNNVYLTSYPWTHHPLSLFFSHRIHQRVIITLSHRDLVIQTQYCSEVILANGHDLYHYNSSRNLLTINLLDIVGIWHNVLLTLIMMTSLSPNVPILFPISWLFIVTILGIFPSI